MTRRLADIPAWLAWSRPDRVVRANWERLSALRMQHRGERCVILANGPSLLSMDLSPARTAVTFGLNRIYLAFDRLPLAPTYYVCVNELILEQFAEEIRRLPMTKFLNWNRRRLFPPDAPAMLFVRLGLGLKERFVTDPVSALSGGGTVTYTALQLAYFMGFQEVILVGLDHSYGESGPANAVRTRRAASDADHFDPHYFPAGIRWQLPDLRRSELAYALARRAFEARGGRVLDATPGGRCPVFEKVDWAGLF